MRPPSLRCVCCPRALFLILALVVLSLCTSPSTEDFFLHWNDPLMTANDLWRFLDQAADPALLWPGDGAILVRRAELVPSTLDVVDSIPVLYPHFLIRAAGSGQAAPFNPGP